MPSQIPFGSVLVVGGCGFLGSHIVQHLLDSGRASKVSVFDISTERNRFDNVSYSAGDLCSKQDIDAVLNASQPDVIIHTASPPANPPLSLDIYQRVNVEGTRNLLACAKAHLSVKAFVFTSSASVVHDNATDLVAADESFPVLRIPEQKDVYSHTKGIADDMVCEANGGGKGGAMRTCCIRPAGIFGERDYGQFAPMARTAMAGKLKFQVGTGRNEFDFTYVGNVAHAHLLAAAQLLQAATSASSSASSPSEVSRDMRVEGEAFLITNDEPWRFWEYARTVGAAVGHPQPLDKVWTIPWWAGQMIGFFSEWGAWIFSLGKRKSTVTRKGMNLSCINRTYRIDKAKRRLGYKPKWTMKEAIKRSADWWKTTAEASNFKAKKQQ